MAEALLSPPYTFPTHLACVWCFCTLLRDLEESLVLAHQYHSTTQHRSIERISL